MHSAAPALPRGGLRAGRRRRGELVTTAWQLVRGSPGRVRTANAGGPQCLLISVGNSRSVRAPFASVVFVSLVCAAAVGCWGRIPADSGAPPRLTPPMAWNSWNSGIPLTEQTVEATIDAMLSSGLRDAGYRYVNLDAGCAAPVRGADGTLRADPAEFPHGIVAAASYAHR